jgi:hypothetical protein
MILATLLNGHDVELSFIEVRILPPPSQPEGAAHQSGTLSSPGKDTTPSDIDEGVAAPSTVDTGLFGSIESSSSNLTYPT